MRRNDFFKYLLLGGGGSESRSELETETLPYTFNSNSYKLRNYRIYGNTVNGESVGDLVETGEHAEEYRVPIKVEGKNLLSPNIEWIRNNVDDPFNKSDSSSTRIKTDLIPINDNKSTLKISGLPSNINLTTYRYYSDSTSTTQMSNNNTGIIPLGAKYVSVLLGGTDFNSETKTLLQNSPIQLEYGSVETPYEPYQPPVTTNIYLPEQIKMVGDEAEYIDFREQKQHFADGTSADVTLPAIPILSGTNTLSVGTTVQPSKIYLQGKISEAEIVSARSLQTNMQSLQPLSLDDEDLELDVMPTDNDLQIDVKPIEKPVLNLNNVSEIENAEIERGVESAE